MAYTEQQIRGLALNFLRQHYKLRPRAGTSGTRAISRPHYYKGITIDARLAFQQPDLHWFTATVEATSVDRAEEVIYRTNWFRIGFHGLLITFGLAVLFLARTQVQGGSIFEAVGRPRVYFVILTSFLLTWVVTSLLLSRLRYYRYIFAVAQFQKFYADAQWIAYDKNIFPGAEDRPKRFWQRERGRRIRKQYKELLRQVTRFGFGLMEVREEGKVRWIIEPSHLDQFGGKRSKLPLWVAAVQQRPQLKGLLKALPPLGKLARRPGSTPAPSALPPAPATGPQTPLETEVPSGNYADPLATNDYRPTAVRLADYAATIVPATPGRPKFYRQPGKRLLRLRWLLRDRVRRLYPPEVRTRIGYYELPAWQRITGIVLALTLGGLLYLQAAWEPAARPGQAGATDPLSPLETATRPSADPLLPGEYDHTLSADGLTARDEALSTPQLTESIDGNERRVDRLHINADGGRSREYQCLSLALLPDTYYLARAGSYPDFGTAYAAARPLNRAIRLPVTVTRTSCVRTGGAGYLVYVGDASKNRRDAEFLIENLEREFDLDLDLLETTPAKY